MILEEIAGKIDGVSQDIWSSMVSIDLELKETLATTSRLDGTVTSSVQIVGSWNGAVCLDMCMELARHATASLLGAEPSEMTHEDIRDAAGELANMTAGGIKELLPDPCQISLPTVVMGTDFEFSVPQGVQVYRSMFSTRHGDFTVTLIRGEESVALSLGQYPLHGKYPLTAQPKI
jgi:chemotaxis protein CheX